jgi:hypothetical protein
VAVEEEVMELPTPPLVLDAVVEAARTLDKLLQGLLHRIPMQL